MRKLEEFVAGLTPYEVDAVAKGIAEWSPGNCKNPNCPKCKDARNRYKARQESQAEALRISQLFNISIEEARECR